MEPNNLSVKPYTTIVIDSKEGLRKKYVEKLVFLFNHLVQYYNINYKEHLVKYKTPLGYEESVIWYNPINPTDRNEEVDYLYGILDKYLTYGILSSHSMLRANEMWNKLKERAGIVE